MIIFLIRVFVNIACLLYTSFRVPASRTSSKLNLSRSIIFMIPLRIQRSSSEMYIRDSCKLRRFGKIHSQMPFPNHGRMVALLPEKIGHRLSALLQKGLRVTAHHIGFQSGPPVIPAGQDAVSGRRTPVSYTHLSVTNTSHT